MPTAGLVGVAGPIEAAGLVSSVAEQVRRVELMEGPSAGGHPSR